MNRRQRIIDGIDLAATEGLEIGALHSPLVARDAAHIYYVDHTDTKSLREKYAGDAKVPPDDIVDVDYVWNNAKLADIVGDRRFDYILASHVIEHAPNLISWLAELASVLRPLGTLRLAIPDKRYTFDFRRQETTLADVLASHLARQSRPGPREILDFWGNIRALDATAAWRGEYPADPGVNIAEIPAALRRASEAAEAGTYHDVHCTVFTPASFVGVMRNLADLGMLDFACANIIVTAHGDAEFFVHLLRVDDAEKVRGSWRWATWYISQ
jgi:SAM-dependent methyltransferase